ncbi:predicted protein [Nematostella vectensis]|uniref:Trichohyalin-plectin-homology domain-containing protein n=1 Tax=Nematostella vectensis TaxID=45351 RepID=A7RHV0_NEMVE|nr:predicted protein [Nematostella vectensis]|eukprot:XP_001641105.1 predicted protein [Nematostella vectensis]
MSSKVTVIQPKDWTRIQNSLARYNKDVARQKAIKEEKLALHNISNEMVKHWDNTIEGLRNKKLQARKIREEKEEAERVKIDIEEAKHQAQKRKEAIEKAKTQQYYQTDRVKTFHSALLLTEVIKEREAQVKMKKGQTNADKIREAHVLRLQQRQFEEAIREDQKRALERYNARREVADFQLFQVKDHIEENHLAKDMDMQEGQNIKQQVDMYESAKKIIEEQRRQEKIQLMKDHQSHLSKRKELQEFERKKQEEEDEEIRQFVYAKKKMSKMRKEKETELFNAFQDHTNRMRQKLADQMQQKVDDEDERIAKALAEREAKREADMKEKRGIHEHRLYQLFMCLQMRESERKAAEEAKRDQEILRKRVESDKLYHAKQVEKKLEKLHETKNLKTFQMDQVGERKVRKEQEKVSDLKTDLANDMLLREEELQFQEYAQHVISEERKRGRNPYPLIKAAQEGPGGGRGPKYEGKNGLRPSFLVSDGTGVQLPNYANATTQGSHTRIYGDPGKSRKRLGFTW